MTIPNQLTLQRLVDGELSEQARVEYLQSIESEPDQWRTVALAFIENQVWQSCALQAFDRNAFRVAPRHATSSAAPSAAPSATSSAAPPAVAGTEKMAHGNVDLHRTERTKESMMKPVTRPPSWWRKQGPRLMLTAAATMFALTLVMRFSATSRTPVGLEKGPANDPRAATKQPAGMVSPEENNALASEPYTLHVGNVNVPVFPQFDQFNSELAKANFRITPIVQKRLLDAGYQVQPDVRFISGQTPDGRRILVPIHSWRVHSFRQ